MMCESRETLPTETHSVIICSIVLHHFFHFQILKSRTCNRKHNFQGTVSDLMLYCDLLFSFCLYTVRKLLKLITPDLQQRLLTLAGGIEEQLNRQPSYCGPCLLFTIHIQNPVSNT